MMKSSSDKMLLFEVSGADEAEDFFRECAALGGKRRIRVGLLESPFIQMPDDPALPRAETLRDVLAGEEPGPVEGNSGRIILLSLRRMNRILEISTGDLLAVAEGGVLFRNLAAAVEKENLYFPFAPELPRADATLAEIIMDGAISRFEGSYGRLREYLLSLELVTPRGTRIHTGSRSIKDVSGYELAGFITGAGGRCGMISRAMLRLLPLPAVRSLYAAEGDPDRLREIAGRLKRALNPASLALFTGRAASAAASAIGGAGEPAGLLLLEHHPSPRGADPGSLPDDVLPDTGRDCTLSRIDLTFEAMLERLIIRALEGAAAEEILHISFDERPEPAGKNWILSWVTLFPGRVNVLSEFERRKGKIVIKDEGLLEELASRRIDPLLSRMRVEIVRNRGGTIDRLRISESDLHGFKGDRDSVQSATPAGFAQVDGLREGILEVFDPGEMMLP
ncbi:MAG: FAD-binding protein [Candidatus Krumholzibacteriota bacterium]|nr:FAD-binding protein [Candidatus Krumholzibacteriota bacterium]